MIGLGEEEPAFSQQAQVLDSECQRERQEYAGTRNTHLTERNELADAPWKYSRVLNEPPMKPHDFCSMRAWRMPMADRRLDLYLMRALRNNEALRVTNAANAMMMAQAP